MSGGLSEAEKQVVKDTLPETVPQEEYKLDPAKVTNQKMSAVAQKYPDDGGKGEGEGEEKEEAKSDEAPEEGEKVESALPKLEPKEAWGADPASLSKAKFQAGQRAT